MKSKSLLTLGITTFILGIVSFIIKAIIGVRIDSNGMMHEPFFLIPMGHLFIFVGIISLITYFILKFHFKNKE